MAATQPSTRSPGPTPFELLGKVVMYAVLVIWFVMVVFPMLWSIMSSLKSDAEIFFSPWSLPSALMWDNFVRAWIKARMGEYLANTLIIIIPALALTLLLSSMVAYVLARFEFRGRTVLRLIVLSGMMVPPQLVILSLFQILLQLNLYNMLTGLALAYVAMQLAMTIYILEGFFAQLPQDLFDAARMDGYSDLEIFWRITLPIGLPAIATTVVLNFIILWNEFLFAIVLLTDDTKRTLPLGIMHFMGAHQLDVGMIATGLMISIAPIILLYACFSDLMIKGMTAGAVR